MAGKVSKKILQDAERESAKIIEEAKKKAEEIIKDAEAEVKKMKEKAMKEGDEVSKTEEDRVITIEKLQQRKRLLQLKREILDSVFEEARNELLNWKSQRYIDFILKKITCCLTTGDEEVIPGRLHSTSLRKQLEKLKKDRNLQFQVSKEDGDFEFGFIIKEKRTEIKYTDKDIIDEVREETEMEIARRLFGDTE